MTCLRKGCLFGLLCVSFVNGNQFVCVCFIPFSFLGLIILVPDHCLSFIFLSSAVLYITSHLPSVTQSNFNVSNHENLFKTGVVGAYECLSLRQVRRNIRDIFSIFFDMKVHWVFSLESLHRGDSNVYTQYTIFITKNKSPLIILYLQLLDFFPTNSKRVRNSRGKQAISVRAIEVLLYIVCVPKTSCFRIQLLLPCACRQ